MTKKRKKLKIKKTKRDVEFIEPGARKQRPRFSLTRSSSFPSSSSLIIIIFSSHLPIPQFSLHSLSLLSLQPKKKVYIFILLL